MDDLNEKVELEFEFMSDGTKYSIQVVDERPNMQLDPTICLFRGDEEDPIAMIHLNPKAPCYGEGHIIAREKVQEPDEPEREEDEEPGPWNELR